jgi:putative SOS response-associated peptidase YedK
MFKHTYNARSETVASKYSFRNAWQRGQFCIIPADSIFEPCYESGKAVRWEIGHGDAHPLGIAGIWETRPDGPDGLPLLSFSMLTINADSHSLMNRFHKPGEEKRSVVILEPQDYAAWLDADVNHAPAFLKPYPAELLKAAAAPEKAAAVEEPPRQADLFSF